MISFSLKKKVYIIIDKTEVGMPKHDTQNKTMTWNTLYKRVITNSKVLSWITS